MKPGQELPIAILDLGKMSDLLSLRQSINSLAKSSITKSASPAELVIAAR